MFDFGKKKDERKKCYLASPFFSDNQIVRLNKVRKILEINGIEVWDAFHDGKIVAPADASFDRKTSFDLNIKRILWSDLVVGITDDKDTGTIFEMGVGFQAGKSVIGYAETLGNKPFNLMLAESCLFVAKDEKELRDRIDDYLHTKTFIEKFQGLIE